jgi:uncharacterized protein (DUF488 family)
MPPNSTKRHHSGVLYTIGHSIHPIEAFVALLSQHQIAVLADVRSMPGSRRWPQFNQEALSASVQQAGTAYEWFKPLGGRRHSKISNSLHSAWNHRAFRAYADYADSPEFVAAVEQLIQMATPSVTAIMCSEGLWWQCHRRIISDHMIVHGWEVRHIMPNGSLVAHSLPDFARVEDGRIIYDGGQRRIL